MRTQGARTPRADAKSITATLTGVFEHPDASQCSTSMTAQYVSQFFSADAARSGTSVVRECRAHQQERARLARRYRQVSVHNLHVSGRRARAIVGGANGYPIGVSLVDGPGGWRLDGSGTAVQAPATDSRSRRKARSTRIGYLLGSSPPAPLSAR